MDTYNTRIANVEARASPRHVAVRISSDRCRIFRAVAKYLLPWDSPDDRKGLVRFAIIHRRSSTVGLYLLDLRESDTRARGVIGCALLASGPVISVARLIILLA
jgi:hypothetical protein